MKEKRRAGEPITDDDLDRIRNICRCGTYLRIRAAIKDGERRMRAAGADR